MAENRLEAIKARYKSLESPINNPNLPGNLMDITNRYRRFIEIVNIIRTLLRQWNVTYSWGESSSWANDIQVKREADINLWLTPIRAEQLYETQIVHQSFINNFIDRFRDVVARFGNVLIWPLLAPFKSAMKKGLANEGFDTGGNLEQIARRFLEKIILPRKPDNDLSQFEQRFPTRGRALVNFETMEPMTASMIITAIIEFFKAISASPKTKNEEEMARIAANNAANAENLIRSEQDGTGSTEEMNFGSLGSLLLIALIVFAVWKLTHR